MSVRSVREMMPPVRTRATHAERIRDVAQDGVVKLRAVVFALVVDDQADAPALHSLCRLLDRSLCEPQILWALQRHLFSTNDKLDELLDIVAAPDSTLAVVEAWAGELERVIRESGKA